MWLFDDRRDAGRRLAERLLEIDETERDSPVVLALPRGGVPVGYEIAERLRAPLDVFIVRKLGVPGHEELAMGAIASGGVRVLNDDIVRMLHIPERWIDEVSEREQREIERREREYRGSRPMVSVTDRTVVLVDDGLATGATMRAGARAIRRIPVRRLIAAVPGARRRAAISSRARSTGWSASSGRSPSSASASGTASSRRRVTPRCASCSPRPPHEEEPMRIRDVEIESASARLAGVLTVPDAAPGVVLFAHGSGSSRHSPRSRFVAEVLHRTGLGTLLFDLLTAEEEIEDRASAHLRFDIELLADRVVGAIDWIAEHPFARGRRLGLFGASTGAAAALVAAARRPRLVDAVVSRGGRPDLAGAFLREVRAATLLVVGSRDTAVLNLNRAAQHEMIAPTELIAIEGATHLFEEPGTLAEAASVAALFLRTHLAPTDEPRLLR